MTPIQPSPDARACSGPEGWSLRVVGPYLVVLLLAVLLAMALRVRFFEHYHQISHTTNLLLDGTRDLLKTAFWVQVLLFWWLALTKLLPPLRRRLPPASRDLIQAARLGAGLSLVNLFSESLAIYWLKIESYELLLESLLLYSAITLNFLFWYWIVDHPPRHPGPLWEARATTPGVSMPYGIVFPEEALERDLLKTESWKPAFTDYLYFTILSSNCFGAPEGHSLVGAPIKRLHMLHSLAILSVFIVILGRAINTLS
ncbi:hypothetical protein [Synechococcus sp. CBW1004]|jgi:hypothetical protein|uniref:hypothetical protein n=1 Tax=Synechococcus sp. CBW1004 TaxID=1353136 RepID=UPI0018CE26C5|nr:hypothetical protein [Synechococcus sp. CBW1004]QPN62517.1 hypothetical protein H8F25_12540 [Synechococcus sp. CBW1004]